MNGKFSAGIVTASLLLAACASKPTRPEGPGHTAALPSGDSSAVAPSPNPSPEAPAPEISAQAPTEVHGTSTLPKFAVFVDGAGLDAIEALGVLQDFEKAGRRPELIAGGGFGCWIAFSWALQNRGSRAEWQAFKWSTWDAIPRRGVLGRLTSLGSRSAFDREFARALPTRSFAIPVGCPVFTRGGGSRFELDPARPLEESFWAQMRIPALGFSVADDETPLSAVAAGTPTPEELDEWTRTLLKSGERVHWLILRTRPETIRAQGPEAWKEFVDLRGSQSQRNAGSGTTSAGHEFSIVDISTANDPQDLLRFELRRNRLLAGRSKGASLRQREGLRRYFAPPPEGH